MLGFYGMEFRVPRVRNQVQIVVFENWMNCWKLERREKIDLGIPPNFLKHHAWGFFSITSQLSLYTNLNSIIVAKLS